MGVIMNKEKIILGLGYINRFVSYICAFLIGFSVIKMRWLWAIIFTILALSIGAFSVWIIDMKGYKELVK